MCGIVLTIGNPERGYKMLEKINHRGNTSKSLIIDNIGLFHRRLAIQGLSEEFDCPYKINDKYYLYNGEIFNFKEVKKDSKSDVEILNTDPIYWDGDFAVISYDEKTETMELFTDKFGKRQLYYKIENGYISSISSEIKALVDEEDELDIVYLTTCARFGYNFGNDRTIVKSIKKFKSGIRYIISDSGKILKENPLDKSILLYEDYNFKELFEKSLRRRLISDIPIAFLYSGGLDSSIVLYHLHKLGQKLEIFTIENGKDVEFAERYAKELGYKINKFKIQYDFKEIEKIHLNNESGCDLGSVIPNWKLFEEIKKQGFNVCITADSADEIFGGYKRMLEFDFQYNDVFNELIYYHFPRLDKEAMTHTIEYRSPFSADYIINYGLKLPYEQRINKKFLKEQYKGLIPNYIINREKEPLKIETIRRDKEKERIELAKLWKDKLFDVFKNGI